MTVNDLQGLGSVVQGDCLEVLKTFPDNSIDLICTDPPYYKVKAEWWDNQWDKPEGFLLWIDRLAEQWQRILKPNGSLYCFASPRMAAKVEVRLSDRFNVLNRIVWQKPPFSTKAEMFVKEDLRSFFPASETLIFCEQYGSDNYADSDAGYSSECGKLRQRVFGRVFGEYLESEFERAGVTRTEIADLFPSRSGNRTGCVSNWMLGLNCPLPEQYQKIKNYLNSLPNSAGDYLARSYEELRQEYEELRQEYEELRQEYEELRQEYEELRRPFCISEDVPYTDVWSFPTVAAYPGKHPCEKPIALLQHIINASSREGAIVLDCFAGSGNTLVAAKSLARQHIGIEIDPHWVTISNQKLGNFDVKQPTLEERIAWLKAQTLSWKISQPKKDRNQLSLNLFAEEVF